MCEQRAAQSQAVTVSADVLGGEGPMGSVFRALDPEPALIAASSHLLGLARA